jgi:ribosome biogenesis GTPase / thiamine phosphate phosphatase
MALDLSSLGWDDGFASSYARFERTDRCPARVISADRGVCTVLAADGAQRASLGGPVLAAAATDVFVLPCAGDWIVLRRWPDERTTVDAILPRRTAIVVDAGGVPEPGAANVDTVGVYVAHHRDRVAARRLVRYVAGSGADVCLIDTTVDRSLIAPGRTLALVGPADDAVAALVQSLAGTALINQRCDARSVLTPIPGGGAVIAVRGIDGAHAVSPTKLVPPVRLS